MTTKYDTNSHSVFLLQYHLILVTKYRRQVLTKRINKRLKEIFEYISKNYNIKLLELNEDKDHIHILFKAHPNSALSKFLNAYKSASSRLIKKEFPKVKEKLWKQHFWSQSFFLVTTGGVTIDVLKKYVESQGQKNAKSI